MNLSIRWLDVLALLMALTGVFLYLYARSSRRALLVSRLNAELQRQGRQNTRNSRSWLAQRDWRSAIVHALRRLGSAVPLFSAAQRTEIGQKLTAAGYRSTHALLIVAALSLLCGLALVALVVLFAWPHFDNQPLIRLAGVLVALYMGALLPRLVLDRMVVRRQRAIARSLPDALDMLVICTNAGLALNGALQRVSEELEAVAPELSDELRLTSSQLQISADTARVLEGLAERTQLPAMRSLVSTLVQSRQYGTAITQALRVLARSERTARMMRLEEAAAKLSVKITLPMILFILPTVLIVAAGPAVLGLMEFFQNQ